MTAPAGVPDSGGEPDHALDAPPPGVDDDLVGRFREGDVTAFEDIYRQHHRYVHLQARRVLGDSHHAEDVAQEAFLRLTRQLLTTTGEIRVRAWLHRTTVNLAIDAHRRARVHQNHQESGAPVEELQRSLDRNDDGHPEHMAEQSEIRAIIGQVIVLLPARYRRILALRELDGLDYPSIAAAMGLSVSAVESLLFRARRRFVEVYVRLSEDPVAARRARRRVPNACVDAERLEATL